MKNKNRRLGIFKYACYILVVIELFMTTAVFSQKIQSNAVPYWNNELSKIAFVPQTAGWYQFRPGIIKNAKQLFINYKLDMGLTNDDEMKLVRTDADGNMQHHRFQQYYKGIKIEGAEFIVHEKNGYASSGNGKLVYKLNKIVQPVISEQLALSKALEFVPSLKYKNNVKDINLVARLQYHPKAELVFQKSNPDSLFSPVNFHLCYHFDIYKENGKGYAVYIEAKTGELINNLPLQSDCSPASVTTNFYGNKTIYTTFQNPNYQLQDNCINTVLSVYNQANDTIQHNDPYLMVNNTNWNQDQDTRSASTSLWCCRRSIDFYQTVFARNGYDNAGGDISIYQNAGFVGVDKNKQHYKYYGNASFSFTGGVMQVGNNTGNTYDGNNDDWNSLDIIGHELTHGVTGNTSNLNYQGESGALNESFSDILGTYIEYWDGGSTFDWLIGEDKGTPIRDMSNPNNYKQPDTYRGLKWYFGPIDNGGVHTNSGVQNYWFYLLSAGGAGVNDNGTSFNVVGVGIQVAGFIAYKTDIYYLTSSADYADARIGSTQAAIDYYGLCSNVSQQVANAWDAVGVTFNGTLYYPTTNPVVGCGTYTAANNFYNFSSTTSLDVALNCAVTFNPSNLPYGYSLSATNSVILYPGFSSLEGSTTDIFIQSCDLESPPVIPGNRQSAPLATQNNSLQSTNKISGFNVYPNPTTSIVHFDFTTDKDESNMVIQVFNVQMQQVKEIKLGNLVKGKQSETLNLSGLSAGVYFLTLQLQSEKLTAKISIIN